MEEKIVTCRKDHVCSACGEVIPKGNSARYQSYRKASYDDEDRQTGIWYVRHYIHDYVCLDENGETITHKPGIDATERTDNKA